MPQTMRRTTVRMPEHFYELLETEAEHSGLSVAGLLREAALARVIWGRAMRGESVYEVAHQVVVAIRPALEGEPEEPGNVQRAVQAILDHAPGGLDDILRQLDQEAPAWASYVRELYEIPPGGFAQDARRLSGRVRPRP